MSDTQWTLVTGASSGIGMEIARIAASKGRDVILSARSRNKLESLAEELRAAHGVEVVVAVADLSEPDGPDRLWEEASAGREIDFLVNNAGLGHYGPFEQGSGWSRERTIIDVNITALTRLMKLALPGMVARGTGRVLNVASMAGFAPGPGMAVYNATKAYVVSLSRATNAELSDSYVSVTALCPGATQTDFFNAADMTDAALIKGRRLPSAASVAELGYRAAIERKPVAIPGIDNRLFGIFAKHMPMAATVGVMKKVLSRRG